MRFESYFASPYQFGRSEPDRLTQPKKIQYHSNKELINEEGTEEQTQTFAGVRGYNILCATGLRHRALPCQPLFGPTICVDWTDGGAPVLGTDFDLDYVSDSSKPIVTLKAGSAWNVRSKNSDNSPGNIGEIRLDPTTLSDDFVVTVANGTDPGASSLGSAVLTATSFTGYSSLGGKIAGDVTGNLLVVKDGGGNGGVIEDLHIGGDLCGNVTAASTNVMFIDGNVDGSFAITDLMLNVHIGGNLDGSVTADSLDGFECTGDLLGDGTRLGIDVNTYTGGRMDIDGEVSGDVTIGVILETDVDIDTLSADFTVTTAVDGNEGQAPTVLQFGTVSSGATVSVADMVGTASPSGPVSRTLRVAGLGQKPLHRDARVHYDHPARSRSSRMIADESESGPDSARMASRSLSRRSAHSRRGRLASAVNSSRSSPSRLRPRRRALSRNS